MMHLRSNRPEAHKRRESRGSPYTLTRVIDLDPVIESECQSKGEKAQRMMKERRSKRVSTKARREMKVTFTQCPNTIINVDDKTYAESQDCARFSDCSLDNGQPEASTSSIALESEVQLCNENLYGTDITMFALLDRLIKNEKQVAVQNCFMDTMRDRQWEIEKEKEEILRELETLRRQMSAQEHDFNKLVDEHCLFEARMDIVEESLASVKITDTNDRSSNGAHQHALGRGCDDIEVDEASLSIQRTDTRSPSASYPSPMPSPDALHRMKTRIPRTVDNDYDDKGSEQILAHIIKRQETRNANDARYNIKHWMRWDEQIDRLAEHMPQVLALGDEAVEKKVVAMIPGRLASRAA